MITIVSIIIISAFFDMEIRGRLIFILCIIIIYLIYSEITKDDGLDSKKIAYAYKKYEYEPEIPNEFVKYKSGIEVAGTYYRQKEASRFINGTSHSIEFEREEDCKYDANAIKIIGITPISRYFIGYVHKEISKQIVDSGLFESIIPQL